VKRVQLAGLAARATLAVGAAASVAVALHPPASGPEAQLRLVDGSLSISNSKAGSAVLNASNMRPGTRSSGTVTITNTGSAQGDFSLSSESMAESPGRGGGLLSAGLRLSISDITSPSAAVGVYAGSLGAMPGLSLGTFRPGESHTYLFTADLPLDASSTIQGASLTVAYRWDASAGGTDGGGDGSGGGGGGGTPTTPGPVITPLKLTLSGKSTWSVRKRTAPVVTARCTRTCSSQASVKVRGMRKRLKLKMRSKPMASAAGSATRFQVVLKKRAKARLRRAVKAHRRIVLDVKVVAVDQYRVVATAHKLIRVKR
jgi:hypothetical protein